MSKREDYRMTTELDTSKSFQQKMMDRIRESIGELMTDEDLKEIVDRGMEEALFKPRCFRSSYGSATEECSLVDKVIKDELHSQMNEAVHTWMSDNQQTLIDAVQNAAKKGAGKCILSALDCRFEQMFNNALQSLDIKPNPY